MIHLVDVIGGKMWYIDGGYYFWTKKDAARHIKSNFQGDRKKELLNELKQHHGRAHSYLR